MPAKRLAALVLALLLTGASSAVEARAGSPAATSLAPLGRPVRAGAAAHRGPSVSAALQSLRASGAITEALYSSDTAIYLAAEHSLARLSGTRREELGAVLANVRAIAAAGELSASRAPAVFLTLERNRLWWTTEPLLSSGERVTFPPSKLIWEYYAGQGIEIQWLATFGAGNAYYNSGHEDANLRRLLAEVIPLATKRAGGIAWEYLFRFDGGAPPWTSGLSQGTALQVLSRAWSRFSEPADLTAAQQALAIYRQPPPQGVRVATRAGALYAEYTYAPGDRILNGFIQALVGIYDYTAITRDPLGLELFEAGDAEARAEVPRYDTGHWSRYDQFGESSLNYHELLTEFLQHLCERTRKGPPIATVPTPSAAPTPPASTTPPPAAGGAPTGGTGAPTGPAGTATAAHPAQSSQIPGDQIYCTTAAHFSEDLGTAPEVTLLSSSLRTGTRAGVQVLLSKIATVTLTIRRGSSVVWTNRATVEGGHPRLLWVTPSRPGSYAVTLSAVDLAGNFSTAQGTIRLTRH